MTSVTVGIKDAPDSCLRLAHQPPSPSVATPPSPGRTRIASPSNVSWRSGALAWPATGIALMR